MKVLFVCTGNICRSPTAEGVVRALCARQGVVAELDSAGTEGYHVGEAPDPRTRKAAERRGYDLSRLRARKVDAADFARFDLILAMDRGHLETLRRQCPLPYRSRLRLFMSYAPDLGEDEVPDPYYGGEAGFERVLDLCEAAAAGLVDALRRGAC